MSRKSRLRALLAKVGRKEVDYSGFERGIDDLKRRLEEDFRARTLEDVNDELRKFRKKIDLSPLLESLEGVKSQLAESGERISADLEERIATVVEMVEANRPDESRHRMLLAEIDFLNEEVRVLKSVDHTPSISKARNEAVAETREAERRLVLSIEGKERGLSKRISEVDTKVESVRGDMTRIDERIDLKAAETLERASRGGSMNRQIRVNGTDVLTRYTDINLTGSITATTDDSNRRVNIAIAGSSDVEWGDITGTLSDQADLQAALDLKAPLASPTFTGTVTAPSLNVSGATASTVAIFDGSKNLISAATSTYPSLTELSYVKGVTSAIQAQIDAKFTLPSLTAGSVLFSNGTTIAQDNANFFWDDTNNRLGIGTGSPSSQLTLSGTNTAVQIANSSNENSYFGTFTNLFQFSYNRVPSTGTIPNSSQSAAYVNVKGGTGVSTIGFSVATAVNTQPIEVMNISTSILVVNELGNDMDFRVESDGDASNLFSDGGTNRIGIGTSVPTAKLHIVNTVASDIGLKIVDPTSSSNLSFTVQNPAGTQNWLSHNTFGGIASVLQIASSGTKYFQMESYASDNNYFSAAGATFAIRTIGAHNMAFFTDTSTQRMLISGATGHLVVGSTSTNGDARVHSIITAGSNHLRLGIDISNTVYGNWSLGSTGNMTMDIAGGSASDPLWLFSDPVAGSSFRPTSSTAPSNGLYLPASNTLGWAVNSAAEMQLTATALSPAADGGLSLGTTALGWQNLFANTGFVLNVENGDWVATHTAGILTVGTGDLRVTSAGTNAESVVTSAGTQTLTNKRVTQRVVTATDDATAVIDVAVTDDYELSAIANNTTFSFTGTPTDGQWIVIRYKDAGVSKTLTWTGFVPIGVTLPAATTAGKWGYVRVKYNAAASAYHALAVTTEA